MKYTILPLIIILPLIVNVLCFNAQAAESNAIAKSPKTHRFYEKEYQKQWCENNNGTLEVVLPDKTRVDCVNNTFAIEFDFVSKWAESIGQALYYSTMLNKQPGIVLISENGDKDLKYIERTNLLAQKLGITVWVMTPEDMEYQRI